MIKSNKFKATKERRESDESSSTLAMESIKLASCNIHKANSSDN